jgi:hypothetical protein
LLVSFHSILANIFEHFFVHQDGKSAAGAEPIPGHSENRAGGR